MSGRSLFLSHPWRVLRWTALAAAVPAVWACTSRTLEAPVVTPTQIFQNQVVQKVNNDIDILFMIDNSSSMDTMQAKLHDQLPTFMMVLQALPMGLPSIHVAVVSSDMGAPSDQGQTGIDCSQTGGDNGQFTVLARGACGATTLKPNADGSPAEFITDDGAGTTTNFTTPDPMGISTVFQCISLLGSAGCGFEHQLASIDRALGSDNQGPAPAINAGFLRPDAYLGIVMLTNEDDCSATPNGGNLAVYSGNGPSGVNDINTPAGPGGPVDGPIANYRCNGGPLGGHLCTDPTGPNPTTLAQPPLNPPADATVGPPPTLALTNCVSNDTGTSGLTPVSQFITDIKSLKPDPANQILVAAVTGVAPAPAAPTPTPYVVEWLPGAGSFAGTEVWPQVEHLCNETDGSFADPAVRISQFVQAFGTNGVLASICDPSYSGSMAAIAAAIGKLIKPKCIAGVIQKDATGQPNCTVTNELKTNGVAKNVAVPACAVNNTAPCWRLLPPGTVDPLDPNPNPQPNNCTTGTQALSVSTDPQNMNPDSLDSLIQCSTCVDTIGAAGCPCVADASKNATGCLCSAAAMPAGCM